MWVLLANAVLIRCYVHVLYSLRWLANITIQVPPFKNSTFMPIHINERWLFGDGRAGMTWAWRGVVKEGVRIEKRRVRIQKGRVRIQKRASAEREVRLEKRSEWTSLTLLHRWNLRPATAIHSTLTNRQGNLPNT